MATSTSQQPIHLVPWANGEDRREGHSILLMLKAIVFFGVILFSGAAGWLFYMSWQPFVLLISPRLYRWLGDRIGAWWAQIPAFLCNYVYGINLVITGDPLDKHDKSAIFISNHTTLFDWLFLWDFFLRQQRLIFEKIILKGSLKSLPFFGWSMQAMKFIFVARNKDIDLPHLRDIMNSYAIEKAPIQLLLFPEGTINDEPGLMSSASYAGKAGLPYRRHSLYPREGALAIAIQAFKNKGLTSLYDITLGYPDVIPRAQFFSGHAPREVYVHVKRYNADDLPASTEEIKDWLVKLWEEKDKTLVRFYEQRLTFDTGAPIPPSVPVRKQFKHQVQMLLAAITFMSPPAFFLIFLFQNWSWTVLLGIVLLALQAILITYFGGLERLELWRNGYLNKRA